MLLPACIISPAAAGEGFRWRAAAAGEINRPDEPQSESMGGIVWVTNSTYWAVTDWRPVVWELELPIDPADGRLKECRLKRMCRPEGAVDVEGIVRDPFDGSMIIADERVGCVRRHDALTGRQIGEIELPPVMKDTYKDSGIESLTMSRDGLTLWTCTEEAVKGDGPRSTKTCGTDVRLVRLRRERKGAQWKCDGQLVYRTDTIVGDPWYSSKNLDLSRSGVAELCVLDDGTLLVLEREFSKVLFPRLRCRVYETDLSGATDVQGLQSIANAPALKRVEKKMLFETTGFTMYEGMCQGPSFPDGSRLVMLVSDGDKRTLRSAFALRLYAR